MSSSAPDYLLKLLVVLCGCGLSHCKAWSILQRTMHSNRQLRSRNVTPKPVTSNERCVGQSEHPDEPLQDTSTLFCMHSQCTSPDLLVSPCPPFVVLAAKPMGSAPALPSNCPSSCSIAVCSSRRACPAGAMSKGRHPKRFSTFACMPCCNCARMEVEQKHREVCSYLRKDSMFCEKQSDQQQPCSSEAQDTRHQCVAQPACGLAVAPFNCIA